MDRFFYCQLFILNKIVSPYCVRTHTQPEWIQYLFKMYGGIDALAIAQCKSMVIGCTKVNILMSNRHCRHVWEFLNSLV